MRCAVYCTVPPPPPSPGCPHIRTGVVGKCVVDCGPRRACPPGQICCPNPCGRQSCVPDPKYGEACACHHFLIIVFVKILEYTLTQTHTDTDMYMYIYTRIHAYIYT